MSFYLEQIVRIPHRQAETQRETETEKRKTERKRQTTGKENNNKKYRLLFV